MDKPTQIKFINELIDHVKDRILSREYPETWDGIELRWLIKAHFDKVVLGSFQDKRNRRFRNFENDCIINNWY